MGQRALSRIGWLLVAAIGTSVRVASAAEPELLQLEKTIPLVGVTGRFDHLALDAARARLYVAALGNDTVEVVDLAAGKRLRPLKKCSRPTGIAFLPRRQRLAVACSGDAALRFYDPASNAIAGEIDGLDDADNVRVDSSERRLFVGYGSGAIAVIDLDTGKQAARIELAAHPESFQLGANSGRVFVNVPGTAEIAAISLAKPGDRESWSTGELRGNYPMALDEARGRLWVVFRHPARLVQMGAASGAVARALPSFGDADDVFVDRKRDRVVVACGEGFVDVVQIGADGSTPRAARVATRRGARTALFSEETDALYVAIPKSEGLGAELRVYRPR